MIEGEDAFTKISTYFDAMLSDLGPAKRKEVSRKIARELRRRNADRIKRNVEPDGGKMAARKQKRRIRRGRRTIKSGLMFRNLYKARSLKLNATADSAQIYIGNFIAERHQFGGRMATGKDGNGKTIYADYPARPLLGFDSEDIDALTEELLLWLDQD